MPCLVEVDESGSGVSLWLIGLGAMHLLAGGDRRLEGVELGGGGPRVEDLFLTAIAEGGP